MRKLHYTFIFFLLFSGGCATIVSKRIYPLHINSEPRKASVTIRDRAGKEIYNGLTPAVVPLRSGAGFFQKAIYTITLNKEGYKERTVEVSATLNAWYFGNIVFGGLIGFLIVDPATGAMYRLNEKLVDETLEAKEKPSQTRTLQLKDINAIPETWKKALVKL